MKKIWLLALCITVLGCVWSTVAFAQTAEEWFLQGNALSRQGRFEEAVEFYQRSIELNADIPVAHYNMGIALKNLHRYEEAALAFEKVVQLEPGNLDAQLSLGNAYNYLERWEDAIASLNIVVHRRQNDAEAHGNLGWAYFNYREGPAFRFLTVLNLEKAVSLFKTQGMPEAAAATQETLDQARERLNEN